MTSMIPGRSTIWSRSGRTAVPPSVSARWSSSSTIFTWCRHNLILRRHALGVVRRNALGMWRWLHRKTSRSRTIRMVRSNRLHNVGHCCTLIRKRRRKSWLTKRSPNDFLIDDIRIHVQHSCCTRQPPELLRNKQRRHDHVHLHLPKKRRNIHWVHHCSNTKKGKIEKIWAQSCWQIRDFKLKNKIEWWKTIIKKTSVSIQFFSLR